MTGARRRQATQAGPSPTRPTQTIAEAFDTSPVKKGDFSDEDDSESDSDKEQRAAGMRKVESGLPKRKGAVSGTAAPPRPFLCRSAETRGRF